MADTALVGAYLEQFFALLPPGRIWPQRSDSALGQLLEALATLLADSHEAVLDVWVNELYPRTTFDLITDWEDAYGLPDPCAPPAQTIEERRDRVVQRMTVRPGPTAQYLLDLAAALRYPTTTIAETGDFEFTVDVPDPRITYARAGSSRCGDLLSKIDRADDLECLLTEQKPAHLTIVFAYSGG